MRRSSAIHPKVLVFARNLFKRSFIFIITYTVDKVKYCNISITPSEIHLTA